MAAACFGQTFYVARSDSITRGVMQFQAPVRLVSFERIRKMSCTVGAPTACLEANGLDSPGIGQWIEVIIKTRCYVDKDNPRVF